MKNNLILFLISAFILIFFSCKDKSNQKTKNKKIYSKNQQYLFDLLDDYKSEYFATQRQDLRDTIQNKYSQKLWYFLDDSLGRYLDSINVSVDTVIQKGWLVTTQFHSRDIEFKFRLEFKDSMDSIRNSYYQWMRNLKPKSQLTLNFVLIGSGELYNPDDSPESLLKLFGPPDTSKEKTKIINGTQHPPVVR